MIDRHAFDDRLEEHRLAGAGRSDDERALAVADWRDEIDGAAGKLGSDLGWTARLQLEFPLRIRGSERSEIGTARCGLRITAVDLLNVYDDDAIAVIMPRGRENLIPSTQHVLTHDLGRNVGVAGLGQIAVRGAANEAALALRIEPARRLTIGHDRRDWCTRCLLSSSASACPSTTTGSWSALLTLPAASTLVAGATSVMPVIALARVALLLLLLVSFA
jgi:hypothetical protein